MKAIKVSRAMHIILCTHQLQVVRTSTSEVLGKFPLFHLCKTDPDGSCKHT